MNSDQTQISALIVSKNGRATVTPSSGFARRLQAEMTFQYQVIWEALTGGETADDNEAGDPSITEHWRELAQAELRKTFGGMAEAVERKVLALRFDPATEHSWELVAVAMREMLQKIQQPIA